MTLPSNCMGTAVSPMSRLPASKQRTPRYTVFVLGRGVFSLHLCTAGSVNDGAGERAHEGTLETVVADIAQ